jgi:hypothetical protein
MSNTKDTLIAIKKALSPGRIETYETASGATDPYDSRAFALYAWNAQVSAALFVPLHICEVVVRNAAADALDAVYGAQWPWDSRFILSLPDVARGYGYSPRADIRRVAAEQPTTGKVIPELKFAFWEQLFTLRHDVRLWHPELKNVFPNHNPADTVVGIRKKIYKHLQVIRQLRNRIAHHEPIFTRNLIEDFSRIVELIELRSAIVAAWMQSNQNASQVIAQRPLFRGGSLWIPSHEEIACLAYEMWQMQGEPLYSDVHNWVSAERLLRG